VFNDALCRKVKADKQHCWTSQQWHPAIRYAQIQIFAPALM
jgi:hypothetical protein